MTAETDLLPLPEWAGGISLLGPVETHGLLHAFSGAVALAAIIVCFGAANALANPKRALRSVPSALYDVSVAVVIAAFLAKMEVIGYARWAVGG